MGSALWLLTLANLLNYLDRYIIASVAPKIEAEFQLSHAQTGMFMSAFMVGYMVTSPIFGWLGDRQNRPRLMGFGVFAWSISTALSGWVSSFIPLLLSRIAVGVGEASYATISPSYIRDRIKDERLVNKAIAFFYTAIPIGAALGYMWGGYMADHHHWRWAFYLGAVPGLILGVCVCFMKESGHNAAVIKEPSPPLSQSLKELFKNRTYRYTVLGYTAHTFGLGGFAAWAPHYSATVLGVSLSEASFKIGAITCVAGVVGTIIGGKWGDLFIPEKNRGGSEAAVGFNKFCAISSLIATPIAFWTLFASDMNHFMIGMLLVQIAMFSAIAPINTATLSSAPTKIAATAFAVQILVIHALGDVISPPLVGWLADHWAMNHAMLVLAASIGLSAVVWWYAGLNKNQDAS